MRSLIPLAIGCALVAACSNEQPQGNEVAVERDFQNQATDSNDVTAIDAVTGEAADMAADVNFIGNEAELNSADDEGPNSAERTNIDAM